VDGFTRSLSWKRRTVARNEIHVAAPPDAVFAVLADPRRYADWVVGTSETTEVDPAWPEVGSKLRYRVGVGPLGLSDVTEVVECEQPRRLLLRARMRPFGETAIELVLEPDGPGTRVVMVEEPVEGLVEATHTRVTDAVLAQRNTITLARLRGLVEGSG
jgi:uncharacterized protein YndB with AHSA1/START domain